MPFRKKIFPRKTIIAGFCLLAGAVALQPAAAQTRLSGLAIAEAAPEQAWRMLDPENTLYMDLPSGRIIIELRPDFAPMHVAQIKTLVRQGFYDGLLFHRVIEGFMAQGGDPTATGTGSSTLPDLQPEFVRNMREANELQLIGRDARAARVGFVGPIPVGAQPETLSEFFVNNESGQPLWGLHCKGVMSMARANDPTSANSQFFLMFNDSRKALDQRYSIWGRIVDGGENSRRISRGEPPVRPTPIVQMRIATDVPINERDTVEVMRTNSSVFMEYVRNTGALADNGYVEDICGVTVPSRVNGKVES